MARGVNKVILIGNLGNDPDTRYTGSGSAITNLSIATDESYKDRQTGQIVPKTEWHRIVLFNRLAEIAKEYLKKGSKVYIEGRLQTRKWQDQAGQDRYSTEIVGNELQMLDARGGGDGASNGSYQSAPQQPRQQAAPQQQSPQQPPQQQPYAPAPNNYGAAPEGRPAYAGNQPNQPAPMPEPFDDMDDDIPF